MKTCLQPILCFIVVFASSLDAQMLGTGIGQHSIAVRSDGAVYTWGSNWGRHQVTFNASNLPSGIYFYRLRAGDFIQTQKMVLMR
ncbi:hypothetical protein BROC_00350 [Candidatus Brocadiaceae bacterium]|nr:hypothetical protein BROC_00350 [Candidatus Brocadiaceae bacterium]